MIEIVRDYVATGLSVIPLRLDGSKAPAIASWKEYQQRRATDEELRHWFSRPAGIGLVCGVVSGGLEVLDFDHDADETFNAWRDLLPRDLRNRLTVVETGGLGYHVIYRCSKISGNTKIAVTAPPDKKVRIESRGQGGYIVGAGSPLEVHNSGNPYVQVEGCVPLPDLSTFTPEERKTMWLLAASLDHQSSIVEAYVAKEAKKYERQEPTGDYADMPGTDFANKVDWKDILQPENWKEVRSGHWRHPSAKTPGHSAVVRENKAGEEVLVVYSTNAGVLAPTDSHKTWGKFEAYAALNHNGDLSKAGKELWSEGYGKR